MFVAGDQLGRYTIQGVLGVGGMGMVYRAHDTRLQRAVAIKLAGYALSVYTINDPAVARALFGMGVDCVITDAPDVICAAGGATTIWVDFPKQKALPLPDWLRAVVSV